MTEPRARRLPLRSVRARVTAVAAVGVLLVLVVAAVAIIAAQRRLLTEELEETLVAAAAIHAGAPSPDPGTVLATPTDDDGVAQIVAADGGVVAATANLAGVPPIAEPPPDGDVVVRTLDTIPVDESSYLVVSRRAGDDVVHVGASLGDVTESTRLLAGLFAVGVPILTAVLALLIWWLVGRTLRPVESIRAEVDAISGAELHRRVPQPPGDDEISRLARTMNSMLDRVETSSDQQRRFVADASHELRTPLTRMRAELEVDLTHPSGSDPHATHRSVLDEVIGLQRLVDDLLALARADSRGSTTGTAAGATPVALAPLARREAERAARPGVLVDVEIDEDDGPDGAVVLGAADDLGRVVANVVDNAARYATRSVHIRVGRDDGVAVLTVSDDGPGIPMADRERIFERFTRLDAARGASTGGAGLGLAIAKDIVERHGGTIRVDGASPPGATIVIELPALAS